MENQTFYTQFYLTSFSVFPKSLPYFFLIFLILYLVGVVANFIIIKVTIEENNLHTPMYFFLCNLSTVDICYITVTLPKLMDILLTRKHSITFIQCFTQLFFFLFLASTEITLLSSMAFDRYVAICRPLYYQTTMSKRNCVIILVGTWLSGFGNSTCVTLYVSGIPFCRSNAIEQFYCEIKALAKIACADKGLGVLILVDTFLFGLCPFLLSLISYAKIISIILKIRSNEGRMKAFSTCTSHLTILLIFYGTIICMYMGPSSKLLNKQDYIFSVFFAAVTPMLNPLIYSLRNKEVRTAIVTNMKRMIYLQ